LEANQIGAGGVRELKRLGVELVVGYQRGPEDAIDDSW
jgi:hypothetical protein